MRVYFIGNSYTHQNDVPGMIARMGAAASPALRIETGDRTPGGCTFERHLAEGVAEAELRAASWDYVVLQEQSQRPVVNPDLMLSTVKKVGAIIAEIGARPVMYMTWARQHIPAQFSRLADSYYACGEALGAKVAPAGLAWQAALAARPGLDFYKEDRAHPKPPGSYLSACVLYEVLTGQAPKPTNEPGVDEATAAFLRGIATKAVADHAR